MTSSGFEPITFRLVAWWLNQLCYRMPHFILMKLLCENCLHYTKNIENLGYYVEYAYQRCGYFVKSYIELGFGIAQSV
jgi:hypothetical protein